MAIFAVLALFSAAGAGQSPAQDPPKTDTAAAAGPDDDKELAVGKEIYDSKCRSCHRSDGRGTLEEMDLSGRVWKHGGTPEDIERAIREGIKGCGMRAMLGDYSDPEIKALVKYVLNFSAGAADDGAQAKPADPPATPAKPPPM